MDNLQRRVNEPRWNTSEKAETAGKAEEERLKMQQVYYFCSEQPEKKINSFANNWHWLIASYWKHNKLFQDNLILKHLKIELIKRRRKTTALADERSFQCMYVIQFLLKRSL